MSPTSVPAGREERLRLEVGRLRAREVRRRFPLVVHVGLSVVASVSVEVPWDRRSEHDAGQRFLVVESLLAAWGEDPAELWLSRPGTPDLHDVDQGWWADGRAAFGARGVPLLGFAVVTRSGWLDPVSGERRVWKRLRLRE